MVSPSVRQLLSPEVEVTGPVASHNMPCAVFREQPAVLDLSYGVFTPSHAAQKNGWLLIRAPKRWQRVVLRIIGCLLD